MWYTGTIKNFSGIVPGGQKNRYHKVACAIINMDPLDIATTRIASKRGLGIGDINKIKVVEETIKNVKVVDFLQHSNFKKQA